MKLLSPKVVLLAVAAFFFVLPAFAQDGPPPDEAREFAGEPKRPNLLESLGLTQDQIRQIRMMNRELKPAREAAQERLRNANRALDMAVYADQLDEADVKVKLREFQEAQAEMARIRFQSELTLRKILTPEQLVKFRGLRDRAAQARENMRMRRQLPPGERPLQRIRQLPRRNRDN